MTQPPGAGKAHLNLSVPIWLKQLVKAHAERQGISQNAAGNLLLQQALQEEIAALVRQSAGMPEDPFAAVAGLAFEDSPARRPQATRKPVTYDLTEKGREALGGPAPERLCGAVLPGSNLACVLPLPANPVRPHSGPHNNGVDLWGPEATS